MIHRIYLDNNATTALDPRVIQIISADLQSPPSNPSSVHLFGREAKNKLLKARESIAQFFKVRPQEVFFTSSGTESMNLLIRGLIDPSKHPHVISSNIEHSCVEETLLDLKSQGCNVSFLPAGLKGAVSLEAVEKAITPETKFFIFGAANSETGVKHDVQGLADLALKFHIALIVDGIAQLGKEPFSFYPGILGAGFSAHKFHGPKGVGFVLLRSHPSFPCKPLLTGGGQEYGLRSGTENLSGILGLKEAIFQIETHLPTAARSIKDLRDHFEKTLLEILPFIQVNGSSDRVCNVSNLCFPDVDAETLLIQLDLHGVAASQGSACSSGALEPSRILLNMGLSRSLAKSSIRFTLSRFTTKAEIDRTIKVLSNILHALSSS